MHRRRVLASLAGAAALPFVRARAEAGPAASPLAVHRIATLDTRTVSLRWPRHVGKNAKLDVHGWGPSPMVVTLTTDQGATGWGQLIGGARDLERLRERVVGRAVADLFAPESGILGAELKPLDIALHDLAGVILELPVWKMLGAVTPTLCPVYSGMIYFDDLEPPGTPAGIDRVLQNCAWDRGHGYRQLKVKIGRGLKWMAPEAGVRRDVEVVRAIAAGLGNTPTIEGVTCSHDDVDFGDNVVRGGRFQVSAEPGFGLALVDPRNRASS